MDIFGHLLWTQKPGQEEGIKQTKIMSRSSENDNKEEGKEEEKEEKEKGEEKEKKEEEKTSYQES